MENIKFVELLDELTGEVLVSGNSSLLVKI